MSDVANGVRQEPTENALNVRPACVESMTRETMRAAPARIFFDRPRPPMNTLSSSSTAFAEPDRPTRGVKCELYHDHRIYYAVTSRGERLPGVRVPLGLETLGDVIADLWADLNRVDPLRLSLVVGDAQSVRPAAHCQCEPARLFVVPRGR
jgi:hypothetical protein